MDFSRDVIFEEGGNVLSLWTVGGVLLKETLLRLRLFCGGCDADAVVLREGRCSDFDCH